MSIAFKIKKYVKFLSLYLLKILSSDNIKFVTACETINDSLKRIKPET